MPSRTRAALASSLALIVLFVIDGCAAITDGDDGQESSSAINAGPATDEGTFRITNYNVARETSFKSEEEFLCSGRGVAMQGTGMRKNGSYVTYVSGGGGWCNKYEKLCNCAAAKFKTTDGVYGSSGKKLTKNVSIAVDKSIIPHGRYVWIAALKRWFRAEDTGGAIKGKKIDVFTDDTNPNYRMDSRVFVSTTTHKPTDPGPDGTGAVLSEDENSETTNEPGETRPNEPPPAPPPPAPEPQGNTPKDPCWAEEIQAWVPHRACAEAIDYSWWQCESGNWVEGATSWSGPLGTCSESHPYPDSSDDF